LLPRLRAEQTAKGGQIIDLRRQVDASQFLKLA
jgi:hypothetical protein